MKYIYIMALLCAILIPGSALADWSDDFLEDFDRFGLDPAVENALDHDVPSNEILTLIISNNDKFQIRTSLKSLYCAGVDRSTVMNAANKLGVTVETVSVALEESLAECGSKMSLADRDLVDEPGAGLGSESSLIKRLGSSNHVASPSVP
jgi:hypothetical protein